MLDKDKYDIHKSKPLRVRYQKSLDFITKSIKPPCNILDIGAVNPFSRILINHGFNVINTSGEDLDQKPELVSIDVDLAIAMEIFEHLVNPFSVLKAIKTKRLIATVPLSLWITKAYRHPTNEWDRHFHEFEDWQFDWLLKKAGWEVIRREKWTSPVSKFGIRPILRKFIPRYYAVEAIKI